MVFLSSLRSSAASALKKPIPSLCLCVSVPLWLVCLSEAIDVFARCRTACRAGLAAPRLCAAGGVLLSAVQALAGDRPGADHARRHPAAVGPRDVRGPRLGGAQ